MHISSIEIENFRSVERTRIDFSRNLLILVGENNAGKTNLMLAVDYFFNPPRKPGINAQSCYMKDTTKLIRTTVHFDRLNGDDKRSLQKYVLDDEKLIVQQTIRFDGEEEPSVEYHGAVPKLHGTYELSETEFEGFKKTRQSNLPKLLYLPAVRDVQGEAGRSSKFLSSLVENLFQSIPEAKKKEMGELASELDKRLNRPESGTDERIESIKALEQELSAVLREFMPGNEIIFRFNIPQFDYFPTPKMLVNDGLVTDLSFKGHGLQSNLFFSLMRLYARRVLSGPEVHRPIVFALEEPEIYLHPHFQRLMLKTLKEMSQSDQIMLTTHSPYFIDMVAQETIGIVRKDNRGTHIFQTLPLFSEEQKQHFKLATDFNPERNELFFAKGIILVEGESDRVAVLLSSRILGIDLDEKGVSVVECGGKDNFPFFLKILNAFNLQYSIMFDTDSDNKEGSAKSTLVRAAINRTLCQCVSEMVPRLESELLPPFVGKMTPTHALQYFRGARPENIPTKLSNLITTTVGP